MTFGVISFYKKQVVLIWQALKDEGLAELTDGEYQVIKPLRKTEKDGEFTEKLRIGTVDAFQGLEFDCVMLSIVRSNDFAGRISCPAHGCYSTSDRCHRIW